MFDRFSEKARRTIFFARYEASQFGSDYIESEHLLLGILREDRGLLELLKIPSAEGLRRKIETRLGPPREKTSTSVDMPLSHECKRALAYAAEDAETLGHKIIDTWHLALGLLRNEQSGAAELLGENGVDHAAFLEIVRKMPEGPAGRSGSLKPAPVSWVQRGVPAPAEEPELEPEMPQPAAASLQIPLTRLQNLLTGARPHLKAFSNADGAARLKRKDWSRTQAMGHLVDWAAIHHGWVAQALTEPKVIAAGYPLDEWVGAQAYDAVRFDNVVELWLRLTQLLLHVMAQVPEARLATPFRVGIAEPTTLLEVIERYVEHGEDLVAQVLVRS
jgi:hypothetical protein